MWPRTGGTSPAMFSFNFPTRGSPKLIAYDNHYNYSEGNFLVSVCRFSSEMFTEFPHRMTNRKSRSEARVLVAFHRLPWRRFALGDFSLWSGTCEIALGHIHIAPQ